MIKLPQQVTALIYKLEDHGHKAFAVGGCVRDSMLGRLPNDWDICTSAEPEEIKRCFQGFRIIETGLKHGTITIVLDGQAFEVTTFRIDGNYSDGRRPDQVRFTSDLTADLSRRDFTINAMAYHPSLGLVDPLKGRQDLEKRFIRCVGNPDDRFQEDALRIMRCVRFSSQLDFEIQEKTAKAMYASLPLLSCISVERIRTEFEKLLCGPSAMQVLSFHRDIIAHIIPEIKPMFDLDQKNIHHIYTVWDHTLHVISHVTNTPVLRLAAFFHDIGKPGKMTVDENGIGHFYKHEALSGDLASQVMDRLKYDNHTKEVVTTIVHNHGIVFQPVQKQARRLLNKLGEEILRLLINLELADVKSQNPIYAGERVSNIQAFAETVDQVLEAEQCFSLRHLALNGRDLLLMGVAQGPEIGRVLNSLLECVLDGSLPNEKEALLRAAKSCLSNYSK